MTDCKNTSTGTGDPNAANGQGVCLPATGSGSTGIINPVSIGQPQLQAPQKPRGILRKILHGTGTVLKTAGETMITVALSGLGAFSEE